MSKQSFLQKAIRYLWKEYGLTADQFDLPEDENATGEYESPKQWIDRLAYKYNVPALDDIYDEQALEKLKRLVGKTKDKKVIEALKTISQYANKQV